MIEGIIKHNFGSYWEINQTLRDKHIQELKKYAIRVYTNRHHTYVQLNIDVHKQKNKQEEGENIIEGEGAVTIGDALEENFPRLFEKCLNDE